MILFRLDHLTREMLECLDVRLELIIVVDQVPAFVLVVR